MPKSTKGISTMFFLSLKSKSKQEKDPLDKPDGEIWKDIWLIFIR